MLAVKDWKVWWFALCVAAYQLSQGYYQYFPTLAKTLGYNDTITLVLCAPPGFASALFTFLLSRFAIWLKTDIHYAYQLPQTLGPRALTLPPHCHFPRDLCNWLDYGHVNHEYCRPLYLHVSLTLSIPRLTPNNSYSFLMEAIPGGFVVILAWVSNTIATPPAKKAVATGIVVAFSQVGSVAGSYIYPIRWGPQYTISFGITIAAAGITVLMCFILRLHLASENKKAQKAAKENPELRPYTYLL